MYINTRAASKGKLTQKTHEGNLYLPPTLFRVTEDNSALKKELVVRRKSRFMACDVHFCFLLLMQEGGKSYLPTNFTLPNAKKDQIFRKEAQTVCVPTLSQHEAENNADSLSKPAGSWEEWRKAKGQGTAHLMVVRVIVFAK